MRWKRISKLEERMVALEESIPYTMPEIIEELSKCMVVMAHDNQAMHGGRIFIPSDKKGIVILGGRSSITDTTIIGEGIDMRTLSEAIEKHGVKVTIEKKEKVKE